MKYSLGINLANSLRHLSPFKNFSIISACLSNNRRTICLYIMPIHYSNMCSERCCEYFISMPLLLYGSIQTDSFSGFV